jgi:hypothetical protein
VGKSYETREDLISEARNIIDGIRPDVLKSVFESSKGILLDCWISGLPDCWIAGIPVVNVWSKIYIFILQCLSNFARGRRVQVNNEHPVIVESSSRHAICLQEFQLENNFSSQCRRKRCTLSRSYICSFSQSWILNLSSTEMEN